MSEFNEGRVAATFQVGARLEDAKEVYEKEIITIDGAKGGLIAGLKSLEDYRLKVQEAGTQAQTPIKETDIGLKHIVFCQELLQKLLREIEAKRVAAHGAVDALKKVVTDTKKLWDEEQKKLKQIQEFEATTPKNMKERPVGYMPKERPIEEYEKETANQFRSSATGTIDLCEHESIVKKKKSRRRADEGKPSRAQ